MRKMIMVTALLALVLAVAAQAAWADSPGIKVMTAWVATDTSGLGVGYLIGSSRDTLAVAAPIPTEDTMKPDSVPAIEAAYKYNAQGVENAMGTFNDDLPVAYSSGLIAYMARVGFNPATVGGPNIPPGSVTPAMMPNGYLLIDQIGKGGWAVQLNPGDTPAALAAAVSTPAPQPVNQSTQAPDYVKPQPSDVRAKPTPQEVTITSPSVPAPGQGSATPQTLTKDQQEAAAKHVPESYITNPPAAHYPQSKPAAKPFPWKWVYIGGGAILLIAAAVVIMTRRRNRYPVYRPKPQYRNNRNAKGSRW